ncbi:hypothetical protein Pfo_026614 [Paulownia fortunei]|nr:hypothetical protein Pfo_026614 [Paulownia fortunei]
MGYGGSVTPQAEFSSNAMMSNPVVPTITNTDRQLNFVLNLGGLSEALLLVLEALMCCLDRRTGSKSYIVGAGDLAITWGDISQYWKWKPHADSRSSEMYSLSGKIKTRMLSPNTTYAAYLVFKLARGSCGLESANAYVRFTDDESSGDAERRAEVVDLVQVSESRADGWREVEIGSFYNDDKGYDGEVEARFMEIKRLHMKSGLIVGGIELRSKCGNIAFASKHRHHLHVIHSDFTIDRSHWKAVLPHDKQEVVRGSASLGGRKMVTI